MLKISMPSTNSIPAMDGCLERIGSLGPARSSCRLGKLKVSVKRDGIDVSIVLSIRWAVLVKSSHSRSCLWTASKTKVVGSS